MIDILTPAENDSLFAKDIQFMWKVFADIENLMR